MLLSLIEIGRTATNYVASVDEYDLAAATDHDHVQRLLEHVRRQEHVIEPGRQVGRVGVVGDRLGSQW